MHAATKQKRFRNFNNRICADTAAAVQHTTAQPQLRISIQQYPKDQPRRDTTALASSDILSPTGSSSHTVHLGTGFGGRCSPFTDILYTKFLGKRFRLSSPKSSVLPRASLAVRASPSSPLPPEVTMLARRSPGLDSAVTLVVVVAVSCVAALEDGGRKGHRPAGAF